MKREAADTLPTTDEGIMTANNQHKAIVRRARHKNTPPNEAVTAAKIALKNAKTPLERAQARVALNLAQKRLDRSKKGTAIALMTAAVLLGCGPEIVYVYPDSGSDVVLDDGGTLGDDAGEALTADAGTPEPDSGSVTPEPDAGTPAIDAGPTLPSCGANVAHPTRPGLCLVRVASADVTCPVGQPLQWSTLDEQQALQGVLPALGGSGGTGLMRRWGGSWLWPDGSSAAVDWAGSTPGTTDGGYAYLATDGLHAYYRPYSFLICMYEVSV